MTEPLEFLKDQFNETAVKMPMTEAAFIAEFAKQYHEHELTEAKKKRAKPAKLSAAQDWLIGIEFERWYLFQEIPDDIFDEVFGLIDEGFRGWVYLFDEFDQAFRKELKIQKSTDKEPLRTERRKRFEATNRRRFDEYQFNEGGSR